MRLFSDFKEGCLPPRVSKIQQGDPHQVIQQQSFCGRYKSYNRDANTRVNTGVTFAAL